MHLKGVEIYGFKSFGERVKIDFDGGITSIVGPNGSGKSNILDSILWVLGEQSYKNIRAKESKDIIFSGGEGKKGANYAEVSLYIDNSDKFFAIEEETLKVTRKIYSTGDNEYLINDKRARLKDIGDMFMDTGIGKSAYSVIGQGKVERIISSSKKEVKEIIEEAAGVKKYQIRKLESEKKLNNIVNEVEKIELILTETFEQRTKIKKQSEKAIAFLNIKEERDSLNKGVLTFEFEKNKENHEKSKEKVNEFEKSIQEIKDEKVEKSKELENIIKDTEEIKLNIEKLFSENENIKNIINNFEKEKATLLEREEGYKREEVEKKERQTSFEVKIKTNEETYKKFLEEKENLINNLNNNEEKVKELEETIQTLDSKKTILERELTIEKNQIIEIEVQKLQYDNAIESSSKRIKESQARINNLSKDLVSLNEKISENKELFIVAEKNKLAKEEQIIENTKNQEICEKQITEFSIKSNRLSEELRREEEEEARVKNRYNSIQRFEENNEGFYKGVKEILNSNIQGVNGALISLITIPEKIEKAIEASIAGNLQDIVVENSQVVKKCIEILKEKKVGKASFFALDILKTFNKREIPNIPGIVGRGSELIGYDKKYQKVIDVVLGNLLIVENIDVGISISKKNLFSGNIATLSGELISGSGRMTGGENKNSAISQMFERRKEMKKLEEAISILENKIEKNRQEKEECSKRLEELDNRTQELDSLDISLRKNYKIYQEEVEAFKEKEEKFLKEKMVSTSEKEEEENYLVEYKKKVEESTSSKLGVEEKVKNLKEGIESKTKEVGEITEKREKINNEYSDYKIRYYNTKDRNAQIENDIEKNLKEKEEIIKEKEGAETRLENLYKALEQIKLDIETINKQKAEKENEYEKENRELLIAKERESFLSIKEKEAIGLIKDIESKIYKEEEKFKSEVEKVDKYQKEIILLEESLNDMNDIKIKDIEENQYKTSVDRVKYLSNKLKDFETVNLLAVEEFKEIDERYNFIKTQKDDLETSRESLLGIIEEISLAIKEKFYDAYNTINNNFNLMCMETLDNSEGSLTLINEEDFENCGVEIFVKFRNKKKQSLTLLSGGEKSMVAIAFIMAIFMYKPSPFTFLDEIEAALDEKNTKKLIGKLKQFTDKSQFILITHNKETMRSSDSIFGVTMNKKIGISKIVPVKF